MKTTKMSLATIQGKLSRAEMKNIMAGNEQEEGVGQCKDECAANSDCATNRYCGGGECGGITIKRCNAYT